MFIIAYLRVWRVSTLRIVCMWTSRWLFIVRFLFHLTLGISHVVLVLADVRSSSVCNSMSTNTRSLCVCKAKTSCTLSKWWSCRSDRRLWRQACKQLSKLGVELGVVLTWLAETENTQKYDPSSTNGMWCGVVEITNPSSFSFVLTDSYLAAGGDVQPTGQNSQRCGRAMARRCQNARCRIYVEL